LSEFRMENLAEFDLFLLPTSLADAAPVLSGSLSGCKDVS
jgi:hypothetical protein